METGSVITLWAAVGAMGTTVCVGVAGLIFSEIKALQRAAEASGKAIQGAVVVVAEIKQTLFSHIEVDDKREKRGDSRYKQIEESLASIKVRLEAMALQLARMSKD